MSRGLFIVFEGIDRAGKTTQAARLVERLSVSRPVRAFRFPYYDSPTGKILRDYLQSGQVLDARTSHLLFCANRSELMAEIEATLASGTTIVCDRYLFSGIAYSMAKGLSAKWCIDLEADMIRPDCILYLGLSPDLVECRADFGKELHDDRVFLKKVESAYVELGVVEPAWYTIDASRPLDQVTEEIAKIVQ